MTIFVKWASLKMFLNRKAYLHVSSQNILCMAYKILMKSYLMTTVDIFLIHEESSF